MHSIDIKTKILAALTIVCGLFLVVSALSTWWTGQSAGRSFDRKTLDSFTAMYQQCVDTEESTLRVLSATIIDSGLLSDLWTEKQPSVVRSRVNPLFDQMREYNGLTHFRLYGTDRRVLAQMSGRKPDNSVIKRVSLVRAVVTGQVQSGIEIDERGKLAIHVVTPIIEKDKLVGLLDLGIDLQSVLADVSRRTGVDYMLNADITYIPGYADGSSPGAETDRYVLTGSSMERVPPQNVLYPNKNDKKTARLRYIDSGRQRYAVRVIPVADSDGHRIGSVCILSGSSGFAGEHGTRTVIMFTVILMAIAAGYVFVQITANRVENDVNHELNRLDDKARQKESGFQKELNKFKKLNLRLQVSRNEIASTAELLDKKVRRAEKRFDESVARTDLIESALRATGMRLAIMDDRYDIRYVDPTTRLIYGNPNHRKCYEYFMQNRNPCTECKVSSVVETGTVMISEQTMPKEDGLPVQLMTAAFPTENGEVLFAESRVDISVRRDMERAFEQKEAALRTALEKSRDTLAAILDATADGILAVNTEGEITHSSASFRALWRTPAELIKTRDSQKVLEHILDQIEEPETFQNQLRDLFRSLPLQPDKETDTITFKDGRVFERSSTAIIKDGRIAGRVWSFLDITERVMAEKERVQKERLQGVLEMAGAACHELNQPLQALSGYAEILAMKVTEDSPLYKYAVTIEEQVRKMGDITRKLQCIAKYETQEYLRGTTIIDIDKASGSSMDSAAGSTEEATDRL